MGTYRSFDTETWRDPWFESISPHAKLMFIYLWTNEAVNQAGLYSITKKRIEFETGLKLDEVVSELHPKVEWNPSLNLVWVKNFCKRQCANPKFFIGAVKQLKSVPGDFIEKFTTYNQSLFDKYSIERPVIPYPNGIDTISIPSQDGIDTHPISGTGSDTDQVQDIKPRAGDKKPSPTRPPAKKFIIPSIQDIASYCEERGSPVNPEKFHAYYESNGWMVGKNHMKDWKAAVRTWEQRDESKGGNGNGRTASPTPFGGAPRVRSDGEYPVDVEVCE